MANTVALLAPTGLLGSQLLPVLAAKHKQGVIRLIVLHRATSDVSKVPSDVEKRVFDFAAVTPELLQTALAGVDVLM
jgi:hypothetical protein